MQKFTFYALFIVDILCVCVAWNNFRIEPRNLQLYVSVFDFGLFFRFGPLLSQKSIKMDDERLKAPDFIHFVCLSLSLSLYHSIAHHPASACLLLSGKSVTQALLFRICFWLSLFDSAHDR